jgi:hypothetical protein
MGCPVNAYVFFVDEQRLGPYRFWQHPHSLILKNDGVETHRIFATAKHLEHWEG